MVLGVFHISWGCWYVASFGSFHLSFGLCKSLHSGELATFGKGADDGVGRPRALIVYLNLQSMAKIMDPILPILSILEYGAIILGSFGGPGSNCTYQPDIGSLSRVVLIISG